MTQNADAIVVGAGFAGLKAAQELTNAGLSVIVLEAKDRVGGRLKRTEVAGRAGDLGGQWVGTGHTVLFAEAERLGIPAYKQYESGKTVMQLLGKLVQFAGNVPKMPILSLLELYRVQKRWERDMKTVPADAPWTAPRAEEWDGQTVESWIVKNVHTKAAREFARLGAAAFVKRCDEFTAKYGDRFKPNKLLRDMAAKGETFYGRYAPQKQAA